MGEQSVSQTVINLNQIRIKGVKFMFGKETNPLGKNAKSFQELAKSGEVQQLMSLLQKNGGVTEAAKSASKGDSAALLGMVQNLMSTPEGADLIENIQKKAKDAGIE